MFGLKKANIRKTLRIMKLTVFFLIMGMGIGYASNSYSQKTRFSLNIKNKSLKEVFNIVEKQSEYIFFYSDNITDVDKKVTVSVKDKTIAEILNDVLVTTGNTYVISDRQIYISKSKKDNVEEAAPQQKAQRRITGLIKDKTGEALIGVTIAIKGTTTATMSNMDGTYVIDVPDNTILVYSYVGHLPQEVPVGSNNIINIILEEDSRTLEEVVVVGFGKQKKESVIGAIQTIKTGDLKLPATNLTNNFAGRIAGVISVQKSGEPGADGASFWIRGVSTYAGGSAQTPLILIDGTESSSYDLNALAPEVIESFSILKDATATALYGSRGANGVMLITTKSGREGKARINIRVEGRISQPTQIPELADGATYMKMFNEAILTRNPSGTPQFTDESIQGVIEKRNPYLFPDIDWYKALFKDVAHSQAAHLNVSGGGQRMDYFISATLNNDMGLLKEASQNPFKNNIQNIRYSFQANVNSYITKTTRVGVKLNVQVQDYKGPKNDVNYLFGRVMWAQPSLFPIMYEQMEGTNYIAWGNKSGGAQLNRYPNPYAEMAAGIDEVFTTTTMATFNFDQDLKFITPGLSANGLFSLKHYGRTTTGKYIVPYYLEADPNTIIRDPATGEYTYDLKAVNTDGTNTASATNSYSGDRLINLTFSVNYQRQFEKNHDVSAQLIYLQRGVYKNNPGGSDYNASLGELNQGFAGRLTYDFSKRYFAEFNFGYNGSDNFDKGKRFGFFPSYAVGYLISNEDYFSPIKEVVSLLKLRASYGKVGNSISNQRFPGYTHVDMNGGGYGFGENLLTSTKGAIITRYGNPNATWEIAKKTNLGLELGLFNDKFLMIADFFHENREQIITERASIPSTTGIGSAVPYANIGKVKNKGIDLSLEYNHAFNKDVILSVRGNMTYAVNKLIDKDEPQYPWDYMFEKGNSLNKVGPAYIALGLFKDDDDVQNSPDQSAVMPNVRPGDIKYKDLNGDGIIDEYDKTYIGNPYIPQIVYGFGASFQYKKWDCSFFFQGVEKVSIYLNDVHPFGTYHKNVLGFVADDYWTESNPNPDAKYPRLSHNTDYQNNQEKSTYWLRNGAFLRLKNAEIGYTHKFMRAYVSGANLLTFSPFKYWDPEIGSKNNDTTSNRGNGLVYPLQKVFNIGMQFNF